MVLQISQAGWQHWNVSDFFPCLFFSAEISCPVFLSALCFSQGQPNLSSSMKSLVTYSSFYHLKDYPSQGI
jgi:hypothetical protein